MKQIKQLLSVYLFKKAVAEADKIAEEKGYTPEIIETWKDEILELLIIVGAMIKDKMSLPFNYAKKLMSLT